MSEPEGFNPSVPPRAVAELTPLVTLPPRSTESLRLITPNSLVTPEGYDVNDPAQAEAYLREVHGYNDLPVIRTPEDVMAALAREPRAAKYKNGEPQNVQEHTLNLTRICLEDAAHRPDLDKELVELMAITHDWPEAFAKDTVISDARAMASKFWREEAGWTLLCHHLGLDNPYMQALKQYRQGNSLEALLVNPNDKNEAYQFQLGDDVRATLHRERQEDFNDLLYGVLPKTVVDRSAFVRTQRIFKQLGGQWSQWGCKPFTGDVNDIVNRAATEVLLAKAAQLKIGRLPIHNLMVAPGPDVTPAELEAMGVPVLDRQRQHHRPTPPTPAGGAGRLAVEQRLYLAA